MKGNKELDIRVLNYLVKEQTPVMYGDQKIIYLVPDRTQIAPAIVKCILKRRGIKTKLCRSDLSIYPVLKITQEQLNALPSDKREFFLSIPTHNKTQNFTKKENDQFNRYFIKTVDRVLGKRTTR